MAERKKIIAGNWKMHKTRPEAKQLTEAIVAGIAKQEHLPIVVICPPYTAMDTVQQVAKGSPAALGAQNMDWHEQGAFTGEISPPMLCELGVTYVICGHSERRQLFGDTNQTVGLRVQAAFKHGLIPILCVGESLDEREANITDSVIARQVAAGIDELSTSDLSKLVIAYEPVWAIGTGKVCEATEANRVAKLIRVTVDNVFANKGLANLIPILYGGSLKPANAEEILSQSDIDGGLIGGASLNAEEFLAIVAAAGKQLNLSSAKA
jgi:triosephosphate isomerase